MVKIIVVLSVLIIEMLVVILVIDDFNYFEFMLYSSIGLVNAILARHIVGNGEKN